jgi:ferredoxin
MIEGRKITVTRLLNTMKISVVYCSPAGTTRKTAEWIAAALTGLSYHPTIIDIAKQKDVKDLYRDTGKAHCLFIGSPVYAYHAIPPIINFIDKLPDDTGGYAVPFVTWGGVTSGIALHEMATRLAAKGYTVIGAATVLAVHSLMWQAENPLGEGHPDAADEKMLREFVTEVIKQIEATTPVPLPLAELDYQPADMRTQMESITLSAAKQLLPPKSVAEKLCTKCRICEDLCPVQAISFEPFPVFHERCIVCYMCLRGCPERAINADFSMLPGWLRQRAVEYNEQLCSKIFLAPLYTTPSK